MGLKYHLMFQVSFYLFLFTWHIFEEKNRLIDSSLNTDDYSHKVISYDLVYLEF